MEDFVYIYETSDIRSALQLSTSYFYKCITQQCNIGKEVWIKYYYGGGLKNNTFVINGDVGIGGTPTIVLYIQNNNDCYNVYRYNGILEVQLTVVENIHHFVLLNIDNIINKLRLFIENQ